MSLIHYDLDGNGVINVLDMNLIGQHFGEYTGKPYPVYDVNGDGVVNYSDYDIVARNADEHA